MNFQEFSIKVHLKLKLEIDLILDYYKLCVLSISFLDAMPVLLYKFSEQTLQPGPSVSLKCIAKGNPPPRIQWTLDGFPIPQSER